MHSILPWTSNSSPVFVLESEEKNTSFVEHLNQYHKFNQDKVNYEFIHKQAVDAFYVFNHTKL